MPLISLKDEKIFYVNNIDPDIYHVLKYIDEPDIDSISFYQKFISLMLTHIKRIYPNRFNKQYFQMLAQKWAIFEKFKKNNPLLISRIVSN
jgi:hypothetical protein